MNTIFDAIMQDRAMFEKYENNPVAKATFFALRRYVAEGNSLTSLPWFDLPNSIKAKKSTQAA